MQSSPERCERPTILRSFHSACARRSSKHQRKPKHPSKYYYDSGNENGKAAAASECCLLPPIPVPCSPSLLVPFPPSSPPPFLLPLSSANRKPVSIIVYDLDHRLQLDFQPSPTWSLRLCLLLPFLALCMHVCVEGSLFTRAFL